MATNTRHTKKGHRTQTTRKSDRVAHNAARPRPMAAAIAGIAGARPGLANEVPNTERLDKHKKKKLFGCRRTKKNNPRDRTEWSYSLPAPSVLSRLSALLPALLTTPAPAPCLLRRNKRELHASHHPTLDAFLSLSLSTPRPSPLLRPRQSPFVSPLFSS